MTKANKGRHNVLQPELRGFSTALVALAEMAPDRLTLSQMVFFLYAAMADQAGRPATFSDIRDATGGKINKSLHTTYKVLLDGSRRSDRPNTPGVGWLTREENPSDNREKFLRLTPKGKRVVSELVEAIKIGGSA